MNGFLGNVKRPSACKRVLARAHLRRQANQGRERSLAPEHREQMDLAAVRQVTIDWAIAPPDDLPNIGAPRFRSDAARLRKVGKTPDALD